MTPERMRVGPTACSLPMRLARALSETWSGSLAFWMVAVGSRWAAAIVVWRRAWICSGLYILVWNLELEVLMKMRTV